MRPDAVKHSFFVEKGSSLSRKLLTFSILLSLAFAVFIASDITSELCCSLHSATAPISTVFNFGTVPEKLIIPDIIGKLEVSEYQYIRRLTYVTNT